MNIKVEYDGKYPNLYSGHLKVWIDGICWDFGNYSLVSGGHIERDEDWDMWATEGPWSIGDWPEGFPEDKYLRMNVLSEINAQIPHGCCGGCI